MHFLADYGLFLAKAVTIVLAILIVFLGILSLTLRGKVKAKEKLEVKNLNEKYKQMRRILKHATLNKSLLKCFLKEEKQTEKSQKNSNAVRKKIYVVEFHGDMRASTVKNLREEITSILMIATPDDEVVVCLDSPGGMVHTYGLAASELARIRQRQIPLTAIVDKVAASGGYLMASVANRIIAAPFAIIGSIGVLAQLPNFNRLLKKHDIDYEQITAGEYKRTLSLFGKNTDKGRKKFQEEINEVYELFKKFVTEYRPQLDINKVATGEYWFGTRALELNLIDELMTSDDYLLKASETADVYKICYSTRKTLGEKLSLTTQAAIDKTLQLKYLF